MLVEIALAAVFVHLLAMAMPLFSQVIIDKVLNHRSLSTLHVLGAGMLLAIGFLFKGTEVPRGFRVPAGATTMT